MEKVLWLDDIRKPSDPNFSIWITAAFGEKIDIIWIKNYNEFVKYLTHNPMPYGISFDHDLGAELSGLDCTKWLIEYCMNNAVRLPKYFVHSANPVGKENIQGYLDNYLKFTEPS